MSVDTEILSSIQSDVEQLKLSEKLESPPTANRADVLSEEESKDESSHVVQTETSPRKLPFSEPAPSSTRAERLQSFQLTEEEQAKYDTVLGHLKSIQELPTSSAKKNKETAPLSDIEKYFLTRECILRYLRATKWNVNDAIKRLEGTIVWRRVYGTDTLTAQAIEPEVFLLTVHI